MEDLYRLKLTGITYNQIESGVYALILEEEQSGRRLPIIIGYPEAQAIECKLQEIVTPRPLTHDLMVSVFDTFGISLKSVVIRKLPNGVFAADLTLQNGKDIRTIDSRSSDAVALAIRVGAPIYTTGEVLEEASFIPGEKQENEERNRPSSTPSRRKSGSAEAAPIKLSEMPDTMLAQMMQKAVEEENYEEAAKIKAEIDRRKE